MRWFFLLAALVAAAVPSAAAPQILLAHLKGGVYIAEDTFFAQENSAVYVGRDHVTVIGATWTPEAAEMLAVEIRRVTSLPITEVIDTNHDPDRTGGNAYFRGIGAEIVSTELTRDLLAREGEDAVRQMRQLFPDYPSIPIVLPDTTFKGDFKLQDGAVRGIYLGPSHKPDDIFVYFPRERVLYGGCVLKPQLGNMEGADLVEYPRTLNKLKALHLKIDVIIAGHYDPVQKPDLIDRFLEMLAQLGK